MVRVQEKTLVKATPDKVWRYLSDFERLPEWRRTVKKVTVTSGSKTEPGCTWHEVHEIEGETLEADRECIELVKNRRFSWRSLNGLTIIGVWELKPRRGGTELTLTYDIGFPYTIGGKTINQKKAAANFGRGLKLDLKQLKRRLETQR